MLPNNDTHWGRRTVLMVTLCQTIEGVRTKLACKNIIKMYNIQIRNSKCGILNESCYVMKHL
jgi:hypothetical protein